MESLIASATSMRHMHLVGAAALLVITLTTLQIGITDARSLTADDGLFPENINKRNTWWSKKSLDTMNTIPHSNYDNADFEFNQCQDALEVYSCYVNKCVQSFFTCSRQSVSEELFGACKMVHRMCAKSCSKGGMLDDLIR
ncbi:uncharacterized protein LOC127862006 [Dreissena polymorpha]|uniref:Uncharacterized protein n=1 Tax=Dreissena polymorpha TaxID=45954 RepID=A0A9D3Y8S4_DREPO|nr:uncharacterized protein LOC127862006 [Dreissena polymorpha]KAH3695928.1 hypothetical protein DPMN_083387 [Dreissena polymorpha]